MVIARSTCLKKRHHSPFSFGKFPSCCPTRTFCPACTPNSNEGGASNTSTIVLPRQNPPISWPGLNGWPCNIGDAAEYTASVYVPGGGGRPRTFVRRAYSTYELDDNYEKKNGINITCLIKIDLYAAHVRRADGYHAKEPMPPTTQKRNTLVKHEQILGALRNPRRNREQFTCSDIRSAAVGR